MQPTVIPSSALELALAELIAGDFAAATVSLFINDVDPGLDAVIADFTLALFAGSTPIAIGAWGFIGLAGNGNAEVLAPTLQWHWTAAPQEDVYGFVVKSAGVGTPFLAYGRLDNPKHMGALTDLLSIVPRLELGPTGFGAFVQASE